MPPEKREKFNIFLPFYWRTVKYNNFRSSKHAKKLNYVEKKLIYDPTSKLKKLKYTFESTTVAKTTAPRGRIRPRKAVAPTPQYW